VTDADDPTNGDTDRLFMRRAIDLAKKADKRVRPNPAVGCVVVADGKIVGEGWHRQLGGPHAEVFALRDAGDQARGATAYVTLEPCNHTGRTPPCADALLQAGVARVVIGAGDPNGIAAGGGAYLRDHGVDVERGIEQATCERVAEVFFVNHRCGRAHLRLKVAATLDGFTAAADGTSQWITGPAARHQVHRLRADADAILVGSGTVLADDPRLSARDVPCEIQPAAVVLDRRLRTPPSASLFSETARENLVYTTTGHGAERRSALESTGAIVVAIDAGDDDEYLRLVLADLLRRGRAAVFAEPGATVAGAVLRAGLVDRVDMMFGAKLLGTGAPVFGNLGANTIAQAVPLVIDELQAVGADAWISARLHQRPGQ